MIYFLHVIQYDLHGFLWIFIYPRCFLVSVAPNILWLITFANFRNNETFHMKRQWWRQKFSTAIASAIIFVAVNVHFTDQNLEVYFWSQF